LAVVIGGVLQRGAYGLHLDKVGFVVPQAHFVAHDAVFHGVFQRRIEQYFHFLATDEPHFYDTFSEASVSRNLHDDAGFACLQF